MTPAIEPHRQRLVLIGHRVVHGGEQFTAPTLITPEVESRLKELIPVALLHNPPALKGERPGLGTPTSTRVPAMGLFRQGFSAQPARDGQHQKHYSGLANQGIPSLWISQDQPPARGRILGRARAATGPGPSRASTDQCSSRGGSLPGRRQERDLNRQQHGLHPSPLKRLVMATRPGSINPGLLLELKREGYDADALANTLQKESGLKGLSGLSCDMREIRTRAEDGHTGAIRTLKMLCQRLNQMLHAIAKNLRGVNVLATYGRNWQTRPPATGRTAAGSALVVGACH